MGWGGVEISRTQVSVASHVKLLEFRRGLTHSQNFSAVGLNDADLYAGQLILI